MLPRAPPFQSRAPETYVEEDGAVHCSRRTRHPGTLIAGHRNFNFRQVCKSIRQNANLKIPCAGLRDDENRHIDLSRNMSNLHAPTVPSGPTTAPIANGRAHNLTFPELQQKKDNIEAELKALGGVLDSVDGPFFVLPHIYSEDRLTGLCSNLAQCRHEYKPPYPRWIPPCRY